MNYRRLKHISVFALCIGGVTGTVGTAVGSPAFIVAGGLLAALASLCSYLCGEAAKQERLNEDRAREELPDSIAMAVRAVGGGAHSEIDDAAKHITEGRPELTVELLLKMRKRQWGLLSDRERYRVLANLGNARLALGESAEAAGSFIRTVEYQPEDEEARCYEALGYFLLNDRGRARELALEICKEHPGLARAHMIRLRTEPQQVPLGDLLDSVPTSVQINPEVALALYERALDQNCLSQAESIVRATTLDEWPLLPLALGSVILQQELAQFPLGLEDPMVGNFERLSEAVHLLSQGLEKLPRDNGDAYRAYLNRGNCYRLMDDLRAARDDFSNARRIASSGEEASLALAATAHQEKKLEEAIDILEEYLENHSSLEARALSAFLLSERNSSGDLSRAEGILLELIPELDGLKEKKVRVEVIEALVDVYLRTDRAEYALDMIRGPSADLLAETERKIVEGRVLLKLGRSEDAITAARTAQAELGEDGEESAVRSLALLLEKLEEYGDAFELWRRVTSLEFVSRDTIHLLRCAQEASQDAFIMEFCSKLRGNGAYSQNALKCEVDSLLTYNEYGRAREALIDYLEARPDDKVVRLNLSMIAIRQGWKDLVETDPEYLPTLDEVSVAGLGERVVDVLRFGPEPLKALDYAYELYRRFPDDSDANRALIMAALFPGHGELEIPEPEVADEGVAICYKEDGVEEPKWVVVEKENPSFTRQEYSTSHSLVQALLGRKVGEPFQLPGSGIKERSGAVVQLLDKRVYRANELMREWARRFPDEFFVESVPVGEGPTQEPFGEILEVMEAVANQNERIEELYSRGSIPVATFANVNKKTVFETVGYLASKSHLKVRACVGSQQELQQAQEVLERARGVVLDPTGIGTLVLLEEIEVIGLLPFSCIVTEGAVQEVREVIRERGPMARRAGYLSARGGRLRMQEVDEAAMAEDVEHLEGVVAELEAACEVIGGSDLAYVNAAERESVLEYMGRESAEAVAAAHNRNAILWSDDRFLHGVVNDILPSSRVWTQAVFVWLNQKGILKRRRRSRATAKLLRFGYVFTGSNGATVLDSCEAALWDPNDSDLRAVLRDFGNPAWQHATALKMTAETMMRIWREAPTEEHARAVSAHLLSSLADRQDHRRIIRAVKGNAESLLGLALTRAAGLRDTLDTFLQTGIAPL